MCLAVPSVGKRAVDGSDQVGRGEPGSDKWASGILGDGQGEESGDFGVVQAAAKQAALGWPGGLGNSSAVMEWGSEPLASWAMARRVPGNPWVVAERRKL